MIEKYFVFKFIKVFNLFIDKNKLLYLSNLFNKLDKYNNGIYEYSISFADNKIDNDYFQFIYIDANTYSSKDPKNFLVRLAIYKSLISINNKSINELFSSLQMISDNNIDLYYGETLSSKNKIFSIWLIFGGVKKGNLVYLNKNTNKLINYIGLNGINLVEDDLLNLGIHYSNVNCYYEAYYLFKNINIYNKCFENLIYNIDTVFKNKFDFFYFYSLKFKGYELYEKFLFIEFLEIFNCDNEKNILFLLDKINFFSNNTIDIKLITNKLKNINGRISLISFDESLNIRLYFRSK